MSEKQSKLNRLLIVIAVVAFGILLFTQQEILRNTWEVLQNANLRIALLLPIIQIINYGFVGEYYRTMFGSFGAKISMGRAWGVVAALNFVNQILPSGGISGISYLAYGFSSKLAAGKTTLIQFGRYVFALFSYGVLLPIALLLIINSGQFESLLDVADKVKGNEGALITVGAFLVLVAAGGILLLNRRASKSFGRGAGRMINWVRRSVFRRKGTWAYVFITNTYNELEEGLDFVKSQGLKSLIPFLFMLGSAICELSIVVLSFRAVGSDIPLALIFISFLAANVAGVISVIPGDVGVHEGVMIAMTTTFGVEVPVALSAILLYRVFNKVIFLPVGFYFYSSLLKPSGLK